MSHHCLELVEVNRRGPCRVVIDLPDRAQSCTAQCTAAGKSEIAQQDALIDLFVRTSRR